LNWYRRHHRRLPWRQTSDPYRILVSEIMLQQTRVATVIPYYRRWLRTFPTVQSLARAPRARVLKLWEGLGYYNRARYLHDAARKLARTRLWSRPDGRTAAALQSLPGVGRYTAAAVASIAFGEPVPVVDGNVARVVARVLCLRNNVRLASTQRRIAHWLQRVMPTDAPGTFNQAMMELGALVCPPRQPQCTACPLQPVCGAARRGQPERFPYRGRRQCIKPVTITAAVIRRGNRIWVQRCPAAGSLAGMWELPTVTNGTGREWFREHYTIMNQRITLRIVTGVSVARRNGRWITRADLRRLTFPAGQRRALERVFAVDPPRGHS
ncbi:MAG: A/G-specific adenine glycosylase, partial [Verrucomicrobiae bacterium]|nr:A/G-specific adenine glycosylase [Verrucomicrobiae bacterium]